jgi:hypothetical protein
MQQKAVIASDSGQGWYSEDQTLDLRFSILIRFNGELNGERGENMTYMPKLFATDEYRWAKWNLSNPRRLMIFCRPSLFAG